MHTKGSCKNIHHILYCLVFTSYSYSLVMCLPCHQTNGWLLGPLPWKKVEEKLGKQSKVGGKRSRRGQSYLLLMCCQSETTTHVHIQKSEMIISELKQEADIRRQITIINCKMFIGLGAITKTAGICAAAVQIPPMQICHKTQSLFCSINGALGKMYL